MLDQFIKWVLVTGGIVVAALMVFGTASLIADAFGWRHGDE